MNMDLGGPTKSGYKFNEVTSLTGVKPYVLRFWESEFDHISPALNDHGQKIYSPKDISAIEKVKRLLFDDKLTIAQAKGYLDRDIIDFEDDEEDLANSFDEVESFEFSNDDIIIEHQVQDGSELPPPLIQALPEEIKIGPVGDEERMALKTIELKKALDAIIEKNSKKETTNVSPVGISPEVINVKKKLVTQRLSDADTVSLVSAKKKLSIVLGRIDTIMRNNGWN